MGTHDFVQIMKADGSPALINIDRIDTVEKDAAGLAIVYIGERKITCDLTYEQFVSKLSQMRFVTE